MKTPRPSYFARQSVHRRVMAVLSVIVVPVIVLLVLHFATVRHLMAVQQQVNHLMAVQVQTDEIVSLVVDVQYGFRGYVITRNEKFLNPLYAAEERLDPALHKLKDMVSDDREQLQMLMQIEPRVRVFLQKKKRLVEAVRIGDMASVREHFDSGEGETVLARIRADYLAFEAVEKERLAGQQDRADRLAALTLYGLTVMVISMLLLWWIGSRWLTQNITTPLVVLTEAAHRFGAGEAVQNIPIESSDELGRLARTMEEMQARISRHITQVEAFHDIGKDISTIGPDGLEGVLKRIAERAGSILDVDLCLVLLWNDKIGCWNVGAASGAWHEMLRGTVLIREETPIAFMALTTGVPQVVPDLSARPEPVLQIRDRLGGRSLLAVPLRGPEKAFGVLALAPTREKRDFLVREVLLAQQFADLASIAIVNARLYEVAQQRGEGLQSRLQELERYAANMAHDLKGPARRMAELASLLQSDYKGRFDERADRYLTWVRDSGQQLMARIEEVLHLARIGSVREMVEPVDPAAVIREVLKGCAEQIARERAEVHVADRFPRLACNHVHLFQVLDNLVRNALKFSADGRAPEVEIGLRKTPAESVLFVRDNGIGILPAERERIFEPFERLGHKDVPGTGIGLAIVKKIIELYQGRVWVESEPEKGTTFYFTLPLYGEIDTPDRRSEGRPS